MKPFNLKLDRIIDLLRLLKEDVGAVYIYAILNGIIQLSLPLGIQAIISFVLGGFVSTSLVVLTTMVILGVFLNGVLQVNQMKLTEKIQQQLFVHYAFSFSEHLRKISPDKIGRGLTEKVNYFLDIIPLQKGVSKLLLDIPAASIQIIFGLLILCFYHPIFIVFGVILLSILFFILRFTGGKGMETSIQESNYKYKTAAALRDTAKSAHQLKYSNGSTLQSDNTDSSVLGYVKSRTEHFMVLLSQYWSLIAFKVLIISIMLVVGVMLLLDQKLNIGQFIAIEIVVITVLNSIEKFIVNLDKVYDIFTAFNKLDQILEIPTEQNGSLHMDAGSKIHIIGKELILETPDHKPVIKSADFIIQQGDKIFITGDDAYAKSVFLETISGFNTNFNGTLLINQIPIHNYHNEKLRSNFGVVRGHHGLFKASILDNITLGRTHISTDQILKIAEKTGFSSLLKDLDKGLDTLWPNNLLTQEHETYMLLLRMLVNKPSVIILEDPFGGMSPKRFEQFMNYLFTELSEITILISCHDAQIGQRCQREFVFEHKELTIHNKKLS